MTYRLWRGAWANPGLEKLNPILDFIVNRNLLVKGNATVKGNLSANLTQLGTWQDYIPTVHAFTLPPPNATQASNFHYTATGRWRKLDTIIFFQVTVSIALPASSNWNSNLYVDLPTKTNFRFVSQGTWRPLSGDDRNYTPCFGVGKVDTNQIMIGLDVNDPSGTAVDPNGAGGVLFSAIGGNNLIIPMDVIVSGYYEYQP